jgi:hypothetical protein
MTSTIVMSGPAPRLPNVSAVLILPAKLQAAGNALSCALGHDDPPGSTYSVPLSANGQEPATHYGCHSWMSPGFVDTIREAIQGRLPEGIEELVATVVSGLICSFDGGMAARDHFDMVLSANGLKQIMPEVQA